MFDGSKDTAMNQIWCSKLLKFLITQLKQIEDMTPKSVTL